MGNNDKNKNNLTTIFFCYILCVFVSHSMYLLKHMVSKEKQNYNKHLFRKQVQLLFDAGKMIHGREHSVSEDGTAYSSAACPVLVLSGIWLCHCIYEK